MMSMKARLGNPRRWSERLIIIATLLAALTPGCNETAPPPAVNTPSPKVPVSVPPPSFKVYKQPSDDVASYVVAEGTTDEQLKSLLWSLRLAVRSHNYKAAGLTRPTEKQFGVPGYSAGLISIYKGAQCANEMWAHSKAGPCGYGEHAAATYQWGLGTDQNPRGNPNNDAGWIWSKRDDKDVTIFDEQDGWVPPPAGRE